LNSASSAVPIEALPQKRGRIRAAVVAELLACWSLIRDLKDITPAGGDLLLGNHTGL